MKLPSKNVENHEKLRFHNSVRPDPGAPGPRKLRVVFPLISVCQNPLNCHMGQNPFLTGVGWGGFCWGGVGWWL